MLHDGVHVLILYSHALARRSRDRLRTANAAVRMLASLTQTVLVCEDLLAMLASLRPSYRLRSGVVTHILLLLGSDATVLR